MSPYLAIGGALAAAAGSFVAATLTFALRKLSRVRLAEHFNRTGRQKLLEPTTRMAGDLVVLTAACRLVLNMVVVVFIIALCDRYIASPLPRYLTVVLVGGVTLLFTSVAFPHALARHAGDSIVAASARPLQLLLLALWPATALMHAIDNNVRRTVGRSSARKPVDSEQEMQQEILSVVEEGEKEGLVDEEEREMIESVIEFHDTTAGQIMTARPEIVAVEVAASLAGVKQTLEESGHSRLPVYNGTLDQIVGVLYARDLLKHIGLPAERFNVKSAMRTAYFVPETKPLRDLLADFRLQKVHLAIVLDEYGGTAGLVTIEDVLEELVGDIIDEHEPVEPAMFKRLDENSAEADARLYVDELNRLMGTNLPEDAGYDTLGGYVSTTLGRIPEPGVAFEHDGARFTVLDAEPRKVNRVKIDLAPAAAPIE